MHAMPGAQIGAGPLPGTPVAPQTATARVPPPRPKPRKPKARVPKEGLVWCDQIAGVPLHARPDFASNVPPPKKKRAATNGAGAPQPAPAPERREDAEQQTAEPTAATAEGGPPAGGAKRKHENNGVRNPVPNLPEGFRLTYMPIGPRDDTAHRAPSVQVVRRVETVAYGNLTKKQNAQKEGYGRPNKTLEEGEYLYAAEYCRRHKYLRKDSKVPRRTHHHAQSPCTAATTLPHDPSSAARADRRVASASTRPSRRSRRSQPVVFHLCWRMT